MDWALVQAFLAVAEEGSLSAAARRLGASQPTLGRQVKALEASVGAPLFNRHARGLSVTEFGLAILPAAQAMHHAMNEIRVAATARETDLSGTVRITASRNTSFYVLPKILAKARQAFPEIQLDLIATDESENLIYGASDIALRMYRPKQLELVTKFIGEIDLGVFAAKSYLDRVGRPKSFEDLMALEFIGFDTDMRLINGMREHGLQAERSDFPLRTDDVVLQWEMLAEGCGLCFCQVHYGAADPRVEQLDLPIPVPSLPIWLTANGAIRHTPRIRAIWDFLAAELPAFCRPGAR